MDAVQIVADALILLGLSYLVVRVRQVSNERVSADLDAAVAAGALEAARSAHRNAAAAYEARMHQRAEDDQVGTKRLWDQVERARGYTDALSGVLIDAARLRDQLRGLVNTLVVLTAPAEGIAAPASPPRSAPILPPAPAAPAGRGAETLAYAGAAPEVEGDAEEQRLTVEVRRSGSDAPADEQATTLFDGSRLAETLVGTGATAAPAPQRTGTLTSEVAPPTGADSRRARRLIPVPSSSGGRRG